MATASFAYLKDLRPYKTSWKIQVKVLHSWRTFTKRAGKTIELVLADSEGTKIQGSINRNLITRFANQMVVGDWKHIENFTLTPATGQYRVTTHTYKLNFLNTTFVSVSTKMSDSQYLSLTPFPQILTDQVDPNILIDVMGEVVNIGHVEELESQNKPVKKIDLELRDENNERLSMTLWGNFADRLFEACHTYFANNERIICVLRFAKIKKYLSNRSVSNSFNASQLSVNPPFPEIKPFLTM